jgi:A/G-specific adenine glycosylase
VGKAPAGAKRLPPIDHGFTHFRLRIKPLLCDVRRRTEGRWLRLEEADAAALPAPVKALLGRLREAAR